MKLQRIIFTYLFLFVTFQVCFAQEKQSENDDAPVLDYELELQRKTNEGSNQKNTISNNHPSIFIGHPPLTEPPIDAGDEHIINHWWLRLPALPIEQSSAIVIGEITNTAAHLSENKNAIYSEFSVQVKKIFKDTTSLIKLTRTVSAIREGGSVRFASGRISKYRVAKKGMPQKGLRYVLFLKQIADSNDYLIITGYKLSNRKVTPLDGEDSKDPRAALVFAKYRGAEESVFLQDLQKALGH